MKALIVSGGKAPSESLLIKYSKDSNVIIGADRGCEALLKNRVTPNYILGDFDSASLDTISNLEELGAIKIQFKKEKDFTDTESAVSLAIEQGSTEIIILGGTGTRYDHVLGNIGLIVKGLRLGVKIEIIDENNRIFMIDKDTKLYGEPGQIISFQAYSEKVEDLNIIGAKYQLKNYDLHLGDSLTVSNEFLDNPIDVKFKNGILMVLYTKD